MSLGSTIALIKTLAGSGGGGGGSSGGGTLVVHSVGGALDKTWQEIHDAAETSVVVFIGIGMEDTGVFPAYLVQAASGKGAYVALFKDIGPAGTLFTYVADSANGYPAYVSE